jgi:ribosomal protein S18 acetylase RimI-like enzyme
MNSTPIRIQPLRLKDVTKLHRLFVAALDSDFGYIDEVHRIAIKRQNSRRRLVATLLKPNRTVFLAWQGRELVGYVIAGMAPQASSNIDWLYMKPELRGHNIGLKLLSRAMRVLMERGAKNINLVTYAYTQYYARQGFRVLRRIDSDGIEQDLMRFGF